MKRIIISGIVIVIIALCGFRYYTINKNFPSKYEKEEYTTSEWINMENIALKFNSWEIIKNTKNEGRSDIIVNITVKKLGEDIDLNEILREAQINITDSKRSLFMYEKVKEFGSDGTVEIKMATSIGNVDIDYIKSGKPILVQLPKELYKKEVEEKVEKGKLYAKYVNISEGKLD